MIVIPAIDLLEGRAVRLREGLRDQATVYSDEPWQLVAEMVASGAERIHVVDLDGAFSGKRSHSEIIARVCKESSVPVQVGGGLRTRAALEGAFSAGVSYSVLGTAAIRDPSFVQEACAGFPDQVIVAVDARDGMVAVEGWAESTTTTATELGKRAAGWGAAALLYTDIARDGVEVGPNIQATAALSAAAGIPVIASGGVSSLDDLRNLRRAKIPMTIVGRALYEKRFTLAEAIGVAKQD